MSVMKRLIVFILLLALGTCYGETPRYFRESAFSCATFAEAVNYFVNVGEDAAVKELNGLALNGGQQFTNGFDVNARIGIICRVLFEPRGDNPIRPPYYGWLDSLGSMGLPPVFPSSSWANVSKYWPFFPVARSGSTYFVLSEGYSFQGFGREEPDQYIAYCRGHFIFRKTLIKVPTRREALKDVATLRKSKSWRAIKWKDSGQGYSLDMGDDGYAWSFIQKQAESIPIR